MKEKIDVLDEFGIRTGEILPRSEIHKQGKIHRAVRLYLIDKSFNLLLQKRSKNTDNFPGVFALSVTGHIEAGEGSMIALEREIKEEVGLNAKDLDIKFLFSYRSDYKVSSSYMDCQYNDIYVCKHDFTLEDIQYDTHDIDEVKFVSFMEFIDMVKNNDSSIAPVYKREYMDVNYFINSFKTS